MPTVAEEPPRRFLARARLRLDRDRRTVPCAAANIARNASAETDRHRRWEPARDALWQQLEPLITPGSRIAIVGAGNGDDLPLARIAAAAAEVVLIDLDPQAARGARRRQGWRLARRIDVIGHDVTGGAADRIAIAAAEDCAPSPSPVTAEPLPGSPYDLVVGDLFYSQLLFPALVDLEVSTEQTDTYICRYGPPLTRAVVARLHASAPAGQVLHLHDPIGWWESRPQPVELNEILRLASEDTEAALELVAIGNGPSHTDPRPALLGLGLKPRRTALWRWPFAAGVDYLACATLAVGRGQI